MGVHAAELQARHAAELQSQSKIQHSYTNPSYDPVQPSLMTCVTLHDLQRLMADPDLRHQVASAMSAALSSILNGNCISDIATDMADVMLSVSAETTPRSRHPRGPLTGLIRGP